MSTSPYTEDSLVQQTTAEYLEKQLGWESVYAYNTEDFGPDSLLGRNSDQEVVLTRTLRDKLIQLNPSLPDAAYDDAVRQITATVASQTIVATNREKHGLIRDGVQVTFRNDKGERVRDRLKVFNFAEPENNDFLCVRELWVRGDLYRRRADIVGFVNGLPLLFIECKNIHRDLKTVAVSLLETLKAEKLRVDQWWNKESTRDAVRVAIQNFLWSDQTGLPVDSYTEDDVQSRSDDVFHHVFRVYPTVPSPYYQYAAA